jgi:SOS-response transcriptional repressor LexA
VLRSLPLYSLAVSAGTGQFLDGESYEMQPVGPEVPEAANFGVRVAGDSMEPHFHSGQTVWVHQQPTLDPGEIGVFLYDGSAYLKQLRRDGGRVFLHSLNPAYADLEVSDALPLRVLGKAVS